MSFDLRTVYNADRPLSWSAISSFEWNAKQWHDKYILKLLPEITPELTFGSYVDKKIQADPKFLPHLERFPIMQHKMFMEFDGIPMIGYADHFDREGLRLKDDKTGRKPWDKKRADTTGQLTLYAFFLYKMEGIKPDSMKFSIDWLPTHIKDGKICFIEPNHKKLKPVTIHTKRTMRDILEFGSRIKRVWQEMEAYCSLDHGKPHIKVTKPVSSMLK